MSRTYAGATEHNHKEATHLLMSIKGRSARQGDPGATKHFIPLVLPDRIAALSRDEARIFVEPIDTRAIDAWSEVTPGGDWTLDWLKQPGDVVRAYEPVIRLCSSASETLDVLSPVDGVLVEIFTGGGEVASNTVLGLIKPARPGTPEIVTRHVWGMRSPLSPGSAGGWVEVDEGYQLKWDASGVRIRVTGDRAKPLTLSWGQLSEYARSVALPIDQRSRIRALLPGPWTKLSANTAGVPKIFDITVEMDMSPEKVATLGPLGLSIMLVTIILQSALQSGASEIYIAPHAKELSVSYRVGNAMWGVMHPPRAMHDVITEYIKTMAKMDEFTQHGTIRLRHRANDVVQEIDLFVLCRQTRFGEAILMRLPG